MSQELGRFAPDEAMRRFIATLTDLHDPLRPLGRYVVTDNSQWSAVGASYVAVNVEGARKLAIYRDGPRPAVGSLLQCVRTGPEATAPWLALPQASGWSVVSAAGVGILNRLGYGGTDWRDRNFETGPNFQAYAWQPPELAHEPSPIAGADNITAYADYPQGEIILRHTFVVPAGTTTATITIAAAQFYLGVWLNAVRVQTESAPTTYGVYDLGPALIPGEAHVLAVEFGYFTGGTQPGISNVAYKIAGS